MKRKKRKTHKERTLSAEHEKDASSQPTNKPIVVNKIYFILAIEKQLLREIIILYTKQLIFNKNNDPMQNSDNEWKNNDKNLLQTRTNEWASKRRVLILVHFCLVCYFVIFLLLSSFSQDIFCVSMFLIFFQSDCGARILFIFHFFVIQGASWGVHHYYSKNQISYLKYVSINPCWNNCNLAQHQNLMWDFSFVFCLAPSPFLLSRSMEEKGIHSLENVCDPGHTRNIVERKSSEFETHIFDIRK